MIEGWTCPRCSALNAEASLVCSTCGQTRPDDEAAAIAPRDPDGVGFAAIARPDAPPPPGEPSLAAIDPSVAPAFDATSGAAAADSSGAIDGWLPPGAPTPPDARPRPLWQRLPIGWVIFGVIVLGAAVGGWYFNAGRSSTGEITKPGDLQAVDLKVGDCFDLKDPSADEVEDVAAVPCTTEHEFELFFVGALPAGDFPGEDVFDAFVNDSCISAFATYVGTAYDDSELDVYSLVPTDDAWRAGDRTVQCAVFHPRIHRLTESLKGSIQ